MAVMVKAVFVEEGSWGRKGDWYLGDPLKI